MFYRPLNEVLKSMIDHPSIKKERKILRIILQRYLVNGTVAVVSTIICLAIFGATSSAWVAYLDGMINVFDVFLFGSDINRCFTGMQR